MKTLKSGLEKWKKKEKWKNMKNTKHVGVYLKLNEVNDHDIIQRLEDVRTEGLPKQTYIKDLIRTDIALDVFRDGVKNGVVEIKKG